MTLPLYKPSGSAHPCKRPADANQGLWYTRFYSGFDSAWGVDDNSKRSWIDDNTGKCGDARALDQHAERIKQLAIALSGHCADFETEWHFATGLGISHPVENGFAWHHTLGVPYFAASGVKGLLRAWTECWREFDTKEARDATIRRCFGTAAGDSDGAGNLIFFDAVPTNRVELAADVMTPHMGKWYEQGDEIHKESDFADKAPADWYSPVPVPFLVVKNAIFRFMVAPRLIGDEARDAHARTDAADAIVQLEAALEWLGAGAKTATGYGRMIRHVPPEERRRKVLAAAGIPQDSGVTWQNAKITWNKGSQTLEVSADGKRCQLKGAGAKGLIDKLSDAGRKRLMDGKKPLVATATVNVEGNNITLTAITEVAP